MEEAHSEFVRFKTTRRAHYDAFAPTDPVDFDTLLWNADGQLTECTRGNIALLIDGQWLTPPVDCGLLAGVGRSVALEEGWLREAVLSVDQDLQRAQALRFINSLRGCLPAHLA
jgi:para-aminobenzoate synthetase/4-amino-4-deoxychorismate lyase